MSEKMTKIKVTIENASFEVSVYPHTNLEDMIRVFEGLLHQMGYYFDGYLKLHEFEKDYLSNE